MKFEGTHVTRLAADTEGKQLFYKGRQLLLAANGVALMTPGTLQLQRNRFEV